MNTILLKAGTALDKLEISQGSVVVLFTCLKERNAKFVELHKTSFEVYTQPCWIKLAELEPGLFKHTKEIEECWQSLIKFKALRKYDRKALKITKDFLQCIESSGRRALNIFYQKMVGQSFFEVNLSGMAPDYCNSFLDYLLEDVANNPQYTYILVVPISERFRIKYNPPFCVTLNEENKATILPTINSQSDLYRQEEGNFRKLELEILNVLGESGISEEYYNKASFILSDDDDPIDETRILKSRWYSLYEFAHYIFYDNWGKLSQCKLEDYAHNRFDSIFAVHIKRRDEERDEMPQLVMRRDDSMNHHTGRNADVNTNHSNWFMFRFFLLSIRLRLTERFCK